MRATVYGAISVLLFASAAIAQSPSTITIDNFGRVDANFFRGAQPEGHEYQDLAALGIKTVINLTSDDGQSTEAGMVAAAGMKYVHIPMTTHVVPTSAQLRQFFSVVNDPQSQPVYVHCVGGSHRTGVMTAVYRMTNEHWTSSKALAEMKTFKFGPVFLHEEFKQFVLTYHVDPALAARAGLPTATKAAS